MTSVKPVRVTVPCNRQEAWRTWMQWDGSPFNHPDCPDSARFYVSFSRDPSFDTETHVEFYDTEEEAVAGRASLVREGFCTSCPWKHTVKEVMRDAGPVS